MICIHCSKEMHPVEDMDEGGKLTPKCPSCNGVLPREDVATLPRQAPPVVQSPTQAGAVSSFLASAKARLADLDALLDGPEGLIAERAQLRRLLRTKKATS